jgi:hypothetical protein
MKEEDTREGMVKSIIDKIKDAKPETGKILKKVICGCLEIKEKKRLPIKEIMKLFKLTEEDYPPFE